MQRKRLLKMLSGVGAAVLIAALLMAGCAAPAPAPAPAPAKAEYQWRLGIDRVGVTMDEGYELFCDLVNEYSDGRIEVTYYPAGALGSHKEIFHAMQAGDIEMSDSVPYVGLVPGGMLAWMPWSTTTPAETALAYRRPDGILYKVMTEAWADVGVKFIVEMAKSSYGILNNVRPIKTPDDFENLKFRVSGSLGFVGAMENMSEGTGLTLETVPWADVYNAYERGVIDASWGHVIHLVEQRFMEVVKYYTVLDWAPEMNSLVMNKELWDTLPTDLQDAINEAASRMSLWRYETERRNAIEYMQMVAGYGVEIYYPTPEEREAFREKANMSVIWEELCKPWLDEHYPGQNMTQKIQDELLRISNVVAGRG